MNQNKYTKTFTLTTSQQALLVWLASGMTIAKIAELSGKTFNNIQKRTQLLYKKFNAKNRQELISKALKLRLISSKEIKSLFKKRFIKLKKEEIKEPNTIISIQEWQYIKLKSRGANINELIEGCRLWSYYGLKGLEYDICKKFNCATIIEALCIAKKFGII